MRKWVAVSIYFSPPPWLRVIVKLWCWSEVTEMILFLVSIRLVTAPLPGILDNKTVQMIITTPTPPATIGLIISRNESVTRWRIPPIHSSSCPNVRLKFLLKSSCEISLSSPLPGRRGKAWGHRTKPSPTRPDYARSALVRRETGGNRGSGGHSSGVRGRWESALPWSWPGPSHHAHQGEDAPAAPIIQIWVVSCQ